MGRDSERDEPLHWGFSFPTDNVGKLFPLQWPKIKMAGLTGFEPATSGLTGRHSNQTELQPRPSGK